MLEAAGVSPRQIGGVYAPGDSQHYVANDPFAAQNRRLSFLIKIAKPGGTKLAASDAAPSN